MSSCPSNAPTGDTTNTKDVASHHGMNSRSSVRSAQYLQASWNKEGLCPTLDVSKTLFTLLFEKKAKLDRTDSYFFFLWQQMRLQLN